MLYSSAVQHSCCISVYEYVMKGKPVQLNKQKSAKLGQEKQTQALGDVDPV